MYKIGAMSIALTKLVDGDNPTTEQILQTAAEIGLDGVEFYETEWGAGEGDLGAAASLRAVADAVGVEIFALGSATRLGYADERKVEALATLKRQIDVASAVGARSVTFPAIDSQPLPPGRDSSQGGLSFANGLGPLVEQMRELADYAGERSLDIALLNHCYFVSTSWHQQWAIRLTGASNAGTCLDPGNYLYYEGEDPLAATQRLAGSVAAVRLGDMQRRDEELVAADFASSGRLRLCDAVIFGEGEVDHDACLRVLHNSGYDGFLSIKSVGQSAAGHADAMRRSLENIRRLVASIPG